MSTQTRYLRRDPVEAQVHDHLPVVVVVVRDGLDDQEPARGLSEELGLDDVGVGPARNPLDHGGAFIDPLLQPREAPVLGLQVVGVDLFWRDLRRVARR